MTPISNPVQLAPGPGWKRSVFSICSIDRNSETMLKGAPIIWTISDNREFDELMTMKLWNEFSKEENLLEFDF